MKLIGSGVLLVAGELQKAALARLESWILVTPEPLPENAAAENVPVMEGFGGSAVFGIVPCMFAPWTEAAVAAFAEFKD